MVATPSAPNESAPATLAGMGWSLFQLAYDLAAGCLWRSFVWLPVSLAVCVPICSLATLVTAWPLFRGGLDWVGWSSLAAALLCHLTAGIVWGVQRTLDRGAKDGLAILDRRLPELIDLLLAPLIRLGEGRVPQVELADVRAYLHQASQHLLKPPEIGRWWRWLHRLTSMAIRWWLRAQLALVEAALAAFQRRGETRISLDSLKNVVLDEAAARGRAIALTKLWQAELVVAAIVFVLLLAPAAVASLLI